MAEHFQDLELTPKMADAIMPFVEDPTKEWYGSELIRRTGQSSGYLYPTLAKFQKHGWLTSGRENIDPRAAGLPTPPVLQDHRRGPRSRPHSAGPPQPAVRPARPGRAAAPRPRRRCAMSGLWWVMGLVAMFVFAAIGDMVSDEIRGWLDRLPRGVLKLATLRLDPADRETTYREVWGPDLDYYLKGDESRPITRLIRGMAFAVSLAWRVRSADAPPRERPK